MRRTDRDRLARLHGTSDYLNLSGPDEAKRQPMDPLFAFSTMALSAIGAVLGTFLKEYFSSRGRKEGEIDAISRNLDEVLRQQRETTRVTEEIRDAVSRQLTHDRELFARYDQLLPESVLRTALNSDLYDKRSNTKFTGKLSDFNHLAKSEGGQFLSEPVAAAFSMYRKKIEELAVFVSIHFFTEYVGLQPDADGYHLLALYPEYRHKPASLTHLTGKPRPTSSTFCVILSSWHTSPSVAA